MIGREATTAVRLLALFAAIATAGCGETDADFVDRFAVVTAGQSRAEVEAVLGIPDESRTLEMPSGPYWGPAESLVPVLGPGTPFEEWRYHRSGQDHYVWFASRTGQPTAEWRLIDKAAYPVGAVFEARQE